MRAGPPRVRRRRGVPVNGLALTSPRLRSRVRQRISTRTCGSSKKDNFAHFQGRHTADSKYHLDSWKYRSKSFVPKTRSIVRKGRRPSRRRFPRMWMCHRRRSGSVEHAPVANAALMKELLNYRLQKSIPGSPPRSGRFRRRKCAVVCSYQDWMHRTETETVLQVGSDGFGNLVQYEAQQEIVVEDRPYIDLVP